MVFYVCSSRGHYEVSFSPSAALALLENLGARQWYLRLEASNSKLAASILVYVAQKIFSLSTQMLNQTLQGEAVRK